MAIKNDIFSAMICVLFINNNLFNTDETASISYKKNYIILYTISENNKFHELFV